MTHPRIAIIGTVNPEIISGPLAAMPAWGSQLKSPRTEIVYAGSAARVAFPLHRLGCRTAIVSVVGRDAFGDGCLAALRAREVDIRGIARLEGRGTASCIALVREDAQRSYVTDTGILAQCDDAFLQQALPLLSACDRVLLTGLFTLPGLTVAGTARLFEALRARGVATLLDTGWQLDGWPAAVQRELPALLRAADVVLPNRDEIARMTGIAGGAEAQLRALRALGARDIYLKLDGDGAACLAGDTPATVPAVPITPVNTTAAGECFNAGVLYGLAEGLPPAGILDFANRLAAHYVATGQYADAATVQGPPETWAGG